MKFLLDYSNHRLFKDPLNVKDKIPNYNYKHIFDKIVEGLAHIRHLLYKTETNIFALDDILYYKINDKDVLKIKEVFNNRMSEFIKAIKNGNPTIIDKYNSTRNELKAAKLKIILEYINRIFDLSNIKEFPIDFILDNPDFPDKTDHTAIKEILSSSHSSSKKNKVKKEMYLDFLNNFLIYLSSKSNIDENDKSRVYIFNIYDNKTKLYFSSHTCFSYIDIFFDFSEEIKFEDFYKKLLYDIYYSKNQQTIDNA